MISYKIAQPADAVLMAHLRHQSWQETYPGIYPDEMLNHYDAEAEQRFSGRLANHAYRGWLLYVNGACAGYAFVGPGNFGQYKDFELCLNNLYILKAYQRMGLGRLAFACIREYCEEQGISKFYCGCNANNDNAMAFYRSMGGIQTDEALPDVPKYDQIVHFEFRQNG